MKNTKLNIVLSAVSLFTIFITTSVVNAAPVRFNQVVQVVNAKPGKAKTGGYTQLRLADDNLVAKSDDDTTSNTTTVSTPQDDRVIVSKTTEIVEDADCDCIDPTPVGGGGFPKWALLGLAAIPVGLILINRGKDSPNPTPTASITPPTTPTGTPTTPVPPGSPTPEPVPEPMTILLFGTGLAGIGVAARRRIRRKDEELSSEEQ